MRHLALIFALFATPAAADCPPGRDKTPELQALVDKANAAQSEAAARGVAGEMWAVLLRAPDGTAQDLLDRALSRRDSYDFRGARSELDKLIAYCPAYAEGYNQRAYIAFLRGEFEAALPDLDAALRLQPLHVGAQSGRALTLMNLGRIAEARRQMLAALENNPWLSERALLSPGAPLGPQGEDI
ncbi:MAG: tetratricopeptide repeat protein [Pseudomonadota bacterium]